MKNRWSRISAFLSEKVKAVKIFLEQHGFFDELIRGIVKFIFFAVIFYLFKQVVW